MSVVEIEFKGRRKGLYENPQEFPLNSHDLVVVQADRGEDIGRVSLTGQEAEDQLKTEAVEPEDLPGVLRRASAEDQTRDLENREMEREARGFFLQQVRELGLGMKLVEIEYQLDRKKLTFYFTADGRVDFRELVKILAQHFRTRIDLRQIGARDETKYFGGIGVCGRILCCATWIREFEPVTTAMLKDQNLLLNPQKNTGLCGKLRCCLRYEVEMYKAMSQELPAVGTRVKGPRGQGKVEKHSFCEWAVGIYWEDGHRAAYSLEQLLEHTNWSVEERESIKGIEFKDDPSLIAPPSSESASTLQEIIETAKQEQKEKDARDGGRKDSSSRRSKPKKKRKKGKGSGNTPDSGDSGESSSKSAKKKGRRSGSRRGDGPRKGGEGKPRNRPQGKDREESGSSGQKRRGRSGEGPGSGRQRKKGGPQNEGRAGGGDERKKTGKGPSKPSGHEGKNRPSSGNGSGSSGDDSPPKTGRRRRR